MEYSLHMAQTIRYYLEMKKLIIKVDNFIQDNIFELPLFADIIDENYLYLGYLSDFHQKKIITIPLDLLDSDDKLWQEYLIENFK